MHIDGKGIAIEEVLSMLREAVRSQPMDQADVTVFVETKQDAAKVQGYTSMSGLEFSATQKDDGYLLTIMGGSCRCV